MWPALLADMAAAAIDAALAVARAETDDAETVWLAVIAMVKCGAWEPQLRQRRRRRLLLGTCRHPAGARQRRPGHRPRCAGLQTGRTRRIRCEQRRSPPDRLAEVIAGYAPEPPPVGGRCRTASEGKNARWCKPEEFEHYENIAHNWEFQAPRLARPIAGDRGPGHSLVRRPSTRMCTGLARPGSPTRCGACASASSTSSWPRKPNAKSSSGPGDCGC